MNQEKNPFGGANPHGLYVPMTEVEQEVLARLIAADDLEVVIHGWGVLDQPQLTFGDLRISIQFKLSFNAPAAPQPLHYLDLELRTRAGLTLFKERQPLMVNGQPIEVAAGVELTMAWDIALHHIDPAVVKAIKPGAVGLTSRRLDKETGEATFKGNMQLTSHQKKLLHHMGKGNQETRKRDLHKAIEVTQKAGQKVKVTGKGVEVR